MQEKSIQTVLHWAKSFQGLNLKESDLQQSVKIAIGLNAAVSDIMNSHCTNFETEPSNFIKLLNDLAPNHDE